MRFHKTLNLKSNYNDMNYILDYLDKKLTLFNYNKDFIDELKLALVEAYSNIIKHSYKGCEGHEIDVYIDITGYKVKIVLRDYGIPPEFIKIPGSLKEIDTDIEGLGLYIISKFTDYFRLRKAGKSNETILIKYKKNELSKKFQFLFIF